jgi:hypothetical protein
MDQYRPCGEFAGQGGAATIGAEMYGQAIKAAQAAGLSRLDRKDFGALIDRLFFP